MLDLLIEGVPVRQVHLRVGVAVCTIRKWAKDWGMTFRVGSRGGWVGSAPADPVEGLVSGVGHGARLTIGGRQLIEYLHGQGMSMRGIARELGVAASTVKRELDRGGGQYRAVRAHEEAAGRRARPKPFKLEDPRLRAFVVAKLNEHWSPEQISRAWACGDNRGVTISPETIYQALYVHGRGALRQELKVEKALRSGRTRRLARSPLALARSKGKSWVEGARIVDRPQEVEGRQVPGHWEGDLIVGANNKSAAITLVERTTGYLLVRPLPACHDTASVIDVLADMISPFPLTLRETITWDQGGEMANAKDLTSRTKTKVYFADPHSPWQRGSNENTNGLLRDYFPKGTDLNDYPPEAFAEAERQLNTRPRKRHGWKTPAELMQKLLDDNAVALTA